MSGFLSRLLLRAGIADGTAEEIPVLRRRTPARFEPPGPGGAAMADVVEDSVTDDVSTVAAPSVETRRAPAGIDVPLQATPAVVPRRETARVIEPTRAPDSRVARRDAEGSAVPHAEGSAAAPSVIGVETSPRSSPTHVQHTSTPQLVGTLTQVTPDIPAPREVRTSRSTDEPATKSRAPADTPRSAADAEPAKPPAPLSPQLPRLRRIETPPAAPNPIQPRAESVPETIIEIGRVEIIASQPAAPRSAPAPRRPTTSLADYLARRRR